MPRVAVGPCTRQGEDYILCHTMPSATLRSEKRCLLTTVASVAILKPLLRVVISVFGASDGGESIKVGCTSGNASVMGTSDRCGCPPNSLEKKPLALDCTSLKAGTAEACVLLDEWNCLRLDFNGRKPLHQR